MQEISLKEARSLVLKSQLLWGAATKDREATLRAIEQIGYVQIDTISVVARAHHHVLRSRVGNYGPDDLKRLEEERKVFDYWAHAAAYLPIRDFKYSLYRKQEIAAGEGHWHKKDTQLMSYVYDRIKAEGPLMSKDFKDVAPKEEGQVWGSHPANRAIRQLFMEGQLMISGRQGFQKIYDLAERVFPEGQHMEIPSREEYLAYVIERDVRSNGLIRIKHMGHLLKKSKDEIQSVIDQLIEKGKIAAYQIKKLEGLVFYAPANWASTTANTPKRRRMHILSPFDNLIIQRNRLQELFGFQYTLECYVPAPKRKVGYFSLPLLWGDTFVGQIDAKADRKRKVLEIRNLVWEDKVKKREALFEPLRKALEEFRQFNACEEVEVLKAIQRKSGFSL